MSEGPHPTLFLPAGHDLPNAAMTRVHLHGNAAWIEHWVNMMVTVAMLRNGCTPDKPLQFLKTQPRFKEKPDNLAKALGINEITKRRVVINACFTAFYAFYKFFFIRLNFSHD